MAVIFLVKVRSWLSNNISLIMKNAVLYKDITSLKASTAGSPPWYCNAMNFNFIYAPTFDSINPHWIRINGNQYWFIVLISHPVRKLERVQSCTFCAWMCRASSSPPLELVTQLVIPSCYWNDWIMIQWRRNSLLLHHQRQLSCPISGTQCHKTRFCEEYTLFCSYLCHEVNSLLISPEKLEGVSITSMAKPNIQEARGTKSMLYLMADMHD